MTIPCTNVTPCIDRNQESFQKTLLNPILSPDIFSLSRKYRRKGDWNLQLAFHPLASVTSNSLSFFLSRSRKWRAVVNAFLAHDVAYANIFPSQAWVASRVDVSREYVSRVTTECVSYGILDKLNPNTADRVASGEFMTCRYAISSWFKDLSIRSTLSSLFPALKVIPLCYLMTPDVAASAYAQSQQLDETITRILRKEYIYRISEEEAPPGYADRLRRYWSCNLFGELRGPIVGTCEALSRFKKECTMNDTYAKRTLSLTEPVSQKEYPQTNQAWQITDGFKRYELERFDEAGIEIDDEHETVFPLEETQMMYHTPRPPILSPAVPKPAQKTCEYPVDGGILARKEFYRKNPHHSEYSCEACKNRRRGM